jgi:hypothetical protein
MIYLFADICNLGCLKSIEAGNARYPITARPYPHDLRRLVFDPGATLVGGADAGWLSKLDSLRPDIWQAT